MKRNTQRKQLVDHLRRSGFAEKFKVEKHHTKNEEIIKKIVDKGFFVEKDINYYVIFDIKHKKKIERIVNEKIDDLIAVEHSFRGENYFLAKVGN